ncbi:enhancer of mRNA-decapping protein 4 isoform X2 [Leptopilina boulardi]|uniref:enhancer of mRNA-decapping protein 4 isoform X2 n=1 Tax=Leptopilina boulardi TaxID=63433 RepID=UPI0021F63A6C|nr:enhancer of mRNA-decapping protein 4 isoform X2 [Leptopilina boulardi]
MLKTDDSLRPYPHYPQTVDFNKQEDQYSTEIFSTDVTVIPAPGIHNHGSSKVKLKNIVDFSWEHRLYIGNLLAIHTSGKYLAYGLKVVNGSGVVRVVNKEVENRILLRLRGPVQDLAFAHVANAILACVDCFGSLYVYTIEALSRELAYSLILQVEAEDVVTISHRVIWCPYIPEEEATDGDEISKLLVLTRGSKAELWSVSAASRLWNKSVKITDPEVKNSGAVLEINEHTDTIVQATFSPDGTALATASYDGEVKFFQVCMFGHGAQQKPRCLHQWRPHNGRPISSLFFLDDHKNYQPDAQFWRFAITGCDHNSELKLWSCELWTCLQTIKFTPRPSSAPAPFLKAGLDLSAGYLLLSDIYNKVLYVLNVTKDKGEAVASINTISQFLLPSPMLSFAIVDAGQRKVKPTGESLEDLCPGDDENEDQLVIRMYLVQPKSLQECHIAFRTATHVAGTCLMDTLTHDSLDYSEDIPEIGAVNHNGLEVINNIEEDRSVSAAIEAATNHAAALNLMTPDAFSSPAKKDSALDSSNNSPELGNVLSASPSLAQAIHALNTSEPPLATSEIEEQAPPSGGSSPSREVREILSLAEPEEGDAETKDDIDELPTNEDPNWPDISMALLKDVNICPNEIKNDQITDQLNNKEEVKSVINCEDDLKWRLLNDNKILNLTSKFDSILEIVQDQRQEIRELRLELSALRSETPLGNRVENAVTRATQQQTATVEQTLFNHIARQHEFLSNIEKSIKENIETSLPQVCENAVEPLKNQLRLDSIKMDELLKANLNQLINGAQMKETIALVAANAAKPTLEILFKETFANTLLPGMEKACQSMFRQIQDTFVRGTKEYLQNVDTVVEKQCQKRYDQKSETLVSVVKDEMHAALTRGLSVLQEGTLRTIRESMRENLTHHFSDISGVRSRATTPGPPAPAVADIQARILSLLQRGQLNSAFQQALSASDLSLVTLVCEKTDPNRVFSSPMGSQGPRSILQQPVILSLVQQLSADLGHRTELKHRWLEEAILNLDPADPVTREHIGTVVSNLHTQLGHFVTANPNHRSARAMKMLAMATRSLCNDRP